MSEPNPEAEAARLLAMPLVTHDEAQAALATAFSATAPADPGAALDEASLPLFGSAGRGVCEQAQAVADALANRLCLSVEHRDHRALLIDHALIRRAAHPLQIAVIGHELARRVGIASFVGECEDEPWTVICGPEGAALVGPGLAPAAARPDVRPRCPHQVSRAVLEHLALAAPDGPAQRAERLLESLPTGDCRRRRP